MGANMRIGALVMAVLVGAVGVWLWCTQIDPQHQRDIARADSLLARRETDSITIAFFLSELDSTRARADARAAAGAGNMAQGRAIAAQPIRRPRTTASDSARFWADSAGKAQQSYTFAAAAAADFQSAYDSTRAALIVARDSIAGMWTEHGKALNQLKTLRDDLARSRSCGNVCPGIVAGVGYTVTGDLTAFVGVGVRIDPIALIRKVL